MKYSKMHLFPFFINDLVESDKLTNKTLSTS